MTRRQRKITATPLGLFGCLCLGWLAGGPVPCASAALEGGELQLREPVLSTGELGRLRGGFVDRDGFMVSFGLQDVVKIDGMVMARTVLKIPKLDMAALEIFVDQNNSADVANPTIALTQPGLADYENNAAQTVVHNSMGNDLTSLVIQNSVDNKVIEHLRVMDVEISGYPSLKNTRMNSMVRARLIESLH